VHVFIKISAIVIGSRNNSHARDVSVTVFVKSLKTIRKVWRYQRGNQKP